MISTLIQLFNEDYMERNKGTITWFKCEDKLPPKKEQVGNLYGYSPIVLVAKGDWFTFGEYCHIPANGEPFWQLKAKWIPTHWAFINLPE